MMVREIERREILRTDADHEDFGARLPHRHGFEGSPRPPTTLLRLWPETSLPPGWRKPSGQRR